MTYAILCPKCKHITAKEDWKYGGNLHWTDAFGSRICPICGANTSEDLLLIRRMSERTVFKKDYKEYQLIFEIDKEYQLIFEIDKLEKEIKEKRRLLETIKSKKKLAEINADIYNKCPLGKKDIIKDKGASFCENWRNGQCKLTQDTQHYLCQFNIFGSKKK